MENAIDINDTVAKKVIDLAKKFFADPQNQKEYEDWHIKKYGYLPNEKGVKNNDNCTC